MLSFIIVKICPSATFEARKIVLHWRTIQNGYLLKLVTSLFNNNYVILILQN